MWLHMCKFNWLSAYKFIWLQVMISRNLAMAMNTLKETSITKSSTKFIISSAAFNLYSYGKALKTSCS